MNTQSIPLFPLHSVLFPSGTLPLRVFEPRYLDMISKCMKNEEGFGICLIREGSEVGKAARTYDIGTLSEISYFQLQSDGVLGITAAGRQRFKILSTLVQPDQLTIAEVQFIPNEAEQPVPPAYSRAVDILRKLLDQLGYPFVKMEKKYHDASWVSCRLAEFLPLRLEVKQQFLQLNDPIERLDRLWEIIIELELR